MASTRQQNPNPKMSFDAFMTREDKRIIRREILEKRKKFLKENFKGYKAASSKIIDTLKNTEEYKNAKVIMCFVSFEDEVRTHEFIKDALKDGKTIVVPYVEKGNPIMIASEINSFNDLKEGFYGILAPEKDKLRPFDKTLIDLIVTPGVAFDTDGYRVGYGGGFYDKFLADIKDKVSLIGIAFNLQKIDEAPRNQFDIPLNALITESGIKRFDRNKEE